MPKKGHPISGETRAALARGRHKQRLRAAEVSSGRNLGGGLYQDNDPRRAHLDVSPAVWLATKTHVGECEYVDEELDDVLLRALRERVVYAQSACTHHEPCFQDVTLATLAAVDKQFRKNGKRMSRGLLKNLPSKPRKKKTTGYREGRPLTEVVAELMK